MKNTIEVFLEDGGYMTRETGNSALIELFGTDTLPTPFLQDTPASSVIETLQRLNPDKEVIFIK